jgi:hypothetical protein
MPQLQKLQLCATHDKVADVDKVSTEMKQAGLYADESWLLSDGPKLLAMTLRRLDLLTQEAQAAEASREEVERVLEELKSSLDLPAMHAAIARADHCNVKKELADAVRGRLEGLQKQLLIRQQLQRCVVSEEFAELDEVIKSAEEAGLGSPERWFLPDGPKLYARVVSRKSQLQEVEAVKVRLTTAAQKFDAVDLHKALSIACELGVPHTKYADAH